MDAFGERTSCYVIRRIALTTRWRYLFLQSDAGMRQLIRGCGPRRVWVLTVAVGLMTATGCNALLARSLLRQRCTGTASQTQRAHLCPGSLTRPPRPSLTLRLI